MTLLLPLFPKFNPRHPFLLALTGLALVACGGTPSSADALQTWGTFREALKLGQSEARVALAGLGAPGAIGVGALAGLAGEITIVDEQVYVAQATGQTCHVSQATDQQATLLARTIVRRWEQHALPDCADYAALEQAIAARLRELGRDATQPTPVRIRGKATQVAYHVIAGACPIANPDGTPPWRFAGPLDELELVGLYVEGAQAQLTHHDRSSHLHVVAKDRMGHLDEIALTGAVLRIPAR